MNNGIFNYNIIFDLIPEQFFMLDNNLMILDLNKAASSLLNADAEYLKYKPINNFLKSEYWDSILTSLEINNETKDHLISFILPDKSRLESYIKTVKIESNGECYIMALIQDKKRIKSSVEENKLIEQQITNVYKLGSIGTLAAGIAHEIGNPLTSISSVVQLIQRTTKEKFTSEKLDLVKNQITRISNIIHQLVEFSSPSASTPKPSDINKLLSSAVSMVKMGRDTGSIQFIQELKHDLPNLSVIPDQLLHVFINLIMNAVDSIDNKSGNIWLNTFREDGHIEVIIRDSGTGIPKKYHDKLFEPFFSTKTPGKGIGLGLWVSYGIIKNLNGNIQVDSEPGLGSIFTIVLPVN